MHGKYFIGGNWKCNGTTAAIKDLVATLNTSEFSSEKVEVMIAPPALYLNLVMQSLKKDISVCSQNVSRTNCGAFTGEIAASQLKEFGIQWTLTGHSERRTLFHETDEDVALKTKLALDHGLNVVVCIGETLEERNAEKTMEVVYRQIEAVKAQCPLELWSRIVIAYEPVWAIGTGVVATPEQAQEVHQWLRQWVVKQLSQEVADSLRIIYGGSVKGSNCKELIALPDVDGFLVGGASLKPEFLTIIESAN